METGFWQLDNEEQKVRSEESKTFPNINQRKKLDKVYNVLRHACLLYITNTESKNIQKKKKERKNVI
jgi:hypothetical protein